MVSTPPSRTETMIALRARREAFRLGAEIAYPALEVPRPPEIHTSLLPSELAVIVIEEEWGEVRHVSVPASMEFTAAEPARIGAVMVRFERR
jgi:hypothetical protein